ncbi:unnamed protein product, partial [Symbiodinium natans]
EQQRRTEARLLEMTRGLRSLENEQHTLGSRSAILAKAQEEAEREIGRQLSEAQQDLKHYASSLRETSVREEELTRHMAQRLRTLEERLATLESEDAAAAVRRLRRQWQEDFQTRLDSLEAQSKRRDLRSDTNDSFCSLVEGIKGEEGTPELPEAFTHALQRLEHHVLDELSKVRERCEELQLPPAQPSALEVASCDDPGDAGGVEELAIKIATCEQRCEDLRSHFAERSAELAVRVQAGFAEAKGHMDVVVSQLGQLGERLRFHEASSGTADDKIQLVQRVERVEARLGDQALAVGSFRSCLEMVRQALGNLKSTIDPVHRAASPPVGALAGALRNAEDELGRLKRRTDQLEASASAWRPPSAEVLLAVPLADMAQQPEHKEEVAAKPAEPRRTLLEADIEGKLNSDEPEHSDREAQVPHAAMATLEVALDSFEAVLRKAEAGWTVPAEPIARQVGGG